MKLLLDESVPRRLAAFFPTPYMTRTVQEMGWAGIGNGLLLSQAAEHGFDALISVDQGIEYQQNANKLPIPIVIMIAVRNRLAELQPLVPHVLDLLSGDLQVQVYRVPQRTE